MKLSRFIFVVIMSSVAVICYASDPHPNLSKTRARINSGISRVGELNLSSIMIWAKKDYQKGYYKESLQKLRYHMAEAPYDPEPWFLQGLIFERLKKYKNAYLSYQRCFSLSKSERALGKMKEMLAKRPKKKKKTQLEPKPVAIETSKITTGEAVVEIKSFAKRAYAAYKALETLQTQARVFEARKGSLAGFSLASVKELKLSTRQMDFSFLGEVTIKGQEVNSSIYQTATIQKESLKPYLSALNLAKKGKFKEAASVLEKLEKVSNEEFLYLIDMYRRLKEEKKEVDFRIKIADSGIKDSGNSYWLAEYFYKNGNHKLAKKYYNDLNSKDSPYYNLVQYKLKIIKEGGSHKLREFMKQLKMKRKLKGSSK
ncbi:MAG: hypothetical protein KC646_08630 [Candidatus Cloacimonetes bacterium]|nr:hypothetical protein [Candidatus Cloacimonadota bacterium]